MKILVLNWQDIRNPHGGGAETHLHEIFSRIASAGHDVTLYCSHFEGAPVHETIDGIKIIREGQRNTFNFYVPRRYYRDFARQDFDIVVDDINKIPFFTPLYVRKPLLAVAHHFFGKSIFAEAGTIAGTYVYAAERSLFAAYKNTPFAVVSDSTRKELLEHNFPEHQVDVIPNCINPGQFPFTIPLKPPYPVIAYFGRLKRYKSVDHLFRAFAGIRNEFPDTELRIMGKGDAEKELRVLAHKLGIENNTRFYGFIAEEDKARLLGEAYCVVNPSMKEGWGIINVEANACGTPVIAANVPGLRDAVRHNQSGLLYEYGNIRALTSALRTVLADTSERTRLSRGAISFARQFDWDESARLMIQLLAKTVAAKRQKYPG